MKDYIYWCEYDDAKTGTRITIELYKAGTGAINKSETNRIELPYNTLSVKNIDIVLNDTRIGLSAPCYATVDVDFATLKNTEHYEDFQETILFPQKIKSFDSIMVNETLGTTWHIYEQHKLIGSAEYGKKRLIFTGQQTVGLEGEFNFSNNKITISIEQITSFLLKRINLMNVFDAYRETERFSDLPMVSDRAQYCTPQVFYNHIGRNKEIGSSRARCSLIFSVWNMNNANNRTRRSRVPNRYPHRDIETYNMGSAIIVLWRLWSLLEFIDRLLAETKKFATREYDEPPSYVPALPVSELHRIQHYSFPLYKQTYDNSGNLGAKLNYTDIFIISRIDDRDEKRDGKPTRPYYDISAKDSILFNDGKYKYAFDFINDLLDNFCVFGSLTDDGISMDYLTGKSAEVIIEIDIDEDGIEHSLYFGVSRYAKLNISNLEFYSEDIRDVNHENSYSETENGLNLMTVFHNQPPNNREGWHKIIAKHTVASRRTPYYPDIMPAPKHYFDWGFWGDLKDEQTENVDYVFDVLKQRDRLGEKFALNLFYLEKGTGDAINPYMNTDKFISVHNGIENIKINNPVPYVAVVGPSKWILRTCVPTRSLQVAQSVLEIKTKGCFHNTIAQYIAEAFNPEIKDGANPRPFCTMALKIPVKQLQNIKIDIQLTDTTLDDISLIWAIVKNATEFRLRTKHKLKNRQLSKDDKWLPYSFKYNVSEGCYEIVLHNIIKD